MAKQGKMHSSPFHVESLQYKYAIENENTDYRIKEKPIECKYYNRARKTCTLWNSGHKGCAFFKCKYLNTTLQRKETCAYCAYYAEGGCYHKHYPVKTNLKLQSGNYCCYFLSQENAPEDYQQTQKRVHLFILKSKVSRLQRSIKSWNRLIESLEPSLKNDKLSKEEREYINNKIENRKTRIKDTTNHIAQIKAEITKLL